MANPQQVVTGRARLSYAHLFTAFVNPNGGDPKFSTTILVPKSDVATKQRIDAAIQAAIQAGVSSRWNGARPP
ncbi:MAG TPA: ssDNA-binding protein, partial [Desulfosporosinus sp.]|nr:ssDNA-binding protein [Desulfosporosinus sp.]